MPKRVSIEWEESQYTTEASNLEKFHSAMESTGSQFTSQVETSNTNLDAAMSSVAGSWSDDDVFSKLKSMVNDTLKGGLQSIDTDVTSGSFLSLKNTVKLCKTCMDNCKQAKHDYDAAKKLFENTSSTKEIDDPDNPGKKKSVHNDLYDTRQADAEKKLGILKNKVTSANTHLYELAQFAFGGASSKNNIGGESTTGAGGIGATPPGTEDPSEETPPETPTDSTGHGPETYGNPQTVGIADVYDYATGGTAGEVSYDADNYANRTFTDYYAGINTQYEYYQTADGNYACTITYSDAETGETYGLPTTFVSNSDGTISASNAEGAVDITGDVRFVVMTADTEHGSQKVPFLWVPGAGTDKYHDCGFAQGDASFIHSNLEGSDAPVMYHDNPAQVDSSYSSYIQQGCLDDGDVWTFGGEFGGVNGMQQISSNQGN